MSRFKQSILIITIVLLISALSFPIYPIENSDLADSTLDQRLNTVEILDSTPSEEDGFNRNRIEFTLNSPSQFNAESIAVDLLLPDAWNVKPSIPEGDGNITHFPFYAAADIYLDEEYIGYIGISPFELSDAGENNPTAIYNQIAIGNVVQWDTDMYYHPIKEDDTTCNAITKVMYSPRLFQDNEERDNTGILAYDKELCKYVGIEIIDGQLDKKIISDDEASIIAKSVAMSLLRSTADPAIDNETINALLNQKLTIKYNGVEQSMKDANGDTVYPISYNGTTYLPVRAICNMLGVDIEWDEQTNTVSISDVFLKLAEEYTSNRITEVQQQQIYWHQRLGADNSSDPAPEIISARVETFDHVVSYKGYQVYKYNGSFLSNAPEKIFCVDEWTMGDDGWYIDLRPQYMIFNDGDSPTLAGVMLCEFTPTGYSEAFYSDLDQWIADFEKSSK